jgi:predicted component of type VI protein secretion system
VQIDNLAVSDHHARISSQDNKLRIEDLDSLNGISLNGAPIEKEWLHSGDRVSIGKHVIIVDLEHDVAIYDKIKPKAATPKLEETYVMASHSRPDSGPYPAQDGTSEEASPDRTRVPSVVVLKGKTAQKEYLLSNRLTLIGKSPMATLRLRMVRSPGCCSDQSAQRRLLLYIAKQAGSAHQWEAGQWTDSFERR